MRRRLTDLLRTVALVTLCTWSLAVYDDAVVASFDPPPGPPSVWDEGRYCSSHTPLRTWWSAAEVTDNAQFSYAVGTSPGSADLLDWTITTSLSAEVTIPAQPYGTVVYFSVRVRCPNTDWSEPGISDGITVARTVSSAAEAKMSPDGEPVIFAHESVITAAYPSFCYVQDTAGVSGIRVEQPLLVAGFFARVAGTLGTIDGERCLKIPEVIPGAPAPTVKPRTATGKTLGGGPLQYDPSTGAGQRAVKAWRWVKVDEKRWERRLLDVSGASNVGLLVRTFGRVTSYASDSFYLDDGSGYDDSEEGSPPGVRVLVAPGIDVPAIGSYAVVTGISSTYFAGGTLWRQIRMREPDDLQMIVEVN